MGELFGVQRPAITKHINNIFKEGELEENAVCSILEHTAKDGKKYQTKYYNLDAIISVGYRVNSSQATQFRIWATARLKEFLIKGFILDDERLGNRKYFGYSVFRTAQRHKDVWLSGNCWGILHIWGWFSVKSAFSTPICGSTP